MALPLYAPLAIGMVMGGVAAAKIVGSFAAGGLARTAGGARAVFSMLADASARTAFLLDPAFLAASAASAVTVLRRPVHAPEPA